MRPDKLLGHVVTVSGSQMTVAFAGDDAQQAIRIGDMVKVSEDRRKVVGTIGEVRFSEEGSAASRVFVVDLLGEIVSKTGQNSQFVRGVSIHPVPGDEVCVADYEDLEVIYTEPSRASIAVGALHHDPERAACVLTDELLNMHFAVLGTSGSGKSCAISLILGAVLDNHPNAHVVMFDPHNEYSNAFPGRSEVISVDTLNLPLWLFDLEELTSVLVRGGSDHEQESQAIILKDAIIWARRHYAGDDFGTTSITADTPVPFRVHELVHYINDQMGRLSKPDSSIPYLRLRTRIESLRGDRRYAFLFQSEDDTLGEIIGRILRMPVQGRPLTIVDLSGVPSEIADVVVSVISRAIFDFAMWAQRDRMPPVLLVCEEAHRYVPADERIGFSETARMITRVAKEGRKYGVSLALVSQRPSELSAPALAQCGTVFALRLGSESDQDFISRTVPDVARGMLAALPSLPTQQAIVSGEGVRIPMRIRFADVPEDRRPRSESAKFSQKWQNDDADQWFIEDGIERWRAQIKEDVRAAT